MVLVEGTRAIVLKPLVDSGTTEGRGQQARTQDPGRVLCRQHAEHGPLIITMLHTPTTELLCPHTQASGDLLRVPKGLGDICPREVVQHIGCVPAWWSGRRGEIFNGQGAFTSRNTQDGPGLSTAIMSKCREVSCPEAPCTMAEWPCMRAHLPA